MSRRLRHERSTTLPTKKKENENEIGHDATVKKFWSRLAAIVYCLLTRNYVTLVSHVFLARSDRSRSRHTINVCQHVVSPCSSISIPRPSLHVKSKIRWCQRVSTCCQFLSGTQPGSVSRIWVGRSDGPGQLIIWAFSLPSATLTQTTPLGTGNSITIALACSLESGGPGSGGRSGLGPPRRSPILILIPIAGAVRSGEQINESCARPLQPPEHPGIGRQETTLSVWRGTQHPVDTWKR
jgi:hypothetical protein